MSKVVMTRDTLKTHQEQFKEYLELLQLKHLLNTSELQKLEDLKQHLKQNQVYITEEIQKVKNIRYRNILMMRYVYQFRWCRIYMNLFKLSTKEDYLVESNRRKMFYWHKRALVALTKVNIEEQTATKTLKQVKKLLLQLKTNGISPQDFINNIFQVISL